MTLVTRIRKVHKNADWETESKIKKDVKTGTIAYVIIRVFFLGKSTTYLPTTRVVTISTSPISRLLTPKLYPISLTAY